MARKNGGIIGPANIPTGAFGSAPGVWSLTEVKKYINEGIWPVATSGFQVQNSLRFDDGSSDYLNRTPASAGNRKTWTWSSWVKLSDETTNPIFGCYTASDTFQNDIAVYSNNSLRVSLTNNGTAYQGNLTTNQVFRDFSAWYHIVVAIDTTQATSSNRMKLYINGSQVTSFSTETYPSQNYESYYNSTIPHNIGLRQRYSEYFNGYIAEAVFIDGQQLDPTSFGETDATTGNWVPKDVSGLTFGTNGFYLPFQNSAALGQDDSGNGNNFTVNNLTSIDQCTDSPTNNFATMNPLGRSGSGTTGLPTFSNGNLTVAMSSDTFAYSTLGVSQGKWYFEYKQSENTADNQGYPIVGFNTTGIGAAGDTIGFRTPSGSNYRGQLGTTNVDNAFLSARVANDIFGFYLDLDNSTLIIHKNGSTYMNTGYTSGLDWSGGLTTTNAQTGFYFPYVQSNTANAFTDSFNFGNAPFTVSSGNTDFHNLGNFEYSPTINGVNYLAICTKNIGLVG